MPAAGSAAPPPRKKFKTSELPLNATQRAAIDSLLHMLKKKGEFDSVRKQVWSHFEDGVRSMPYGLMEKLKLTP